MHGIFIEMENNPTNQTLKEAMKTNNATTAYFIIEKPRPGTEEYNRITQQAKQNNLQNLPLSRRRKTPHIRLPKIRPKRFQQTP
ncbi:MAG: hypothetical protein ACE5L6_02495 [Candidatus Bathyarchaeia archaeon]